MMQQACQWIDSNTCRSRRKKEGRKKGRKGGGGVFLAN
jgi:hypothetical protein